MLHSGRPSVSRMVLQMHGSGETPDAATKLVEGARMLRLKGARGRVVVMAGGQRGGFAELAGIEQHEAVYVLAHSDGKEVAGLAPRDLAVLLNQHLPEGYDGKIKLVACHTGEARIESGGQLVSYAQKLALELHELQRDAIHSVHGRPGIATLDPTTGKRRVIATAELNSAVSMALQIFEWVGRTGAHEAMDKEKQRLEELLKAARAHQFKLESERDTLLADPLKEINEKYQALSEREDQERLSLEAAESHREKAIARKTELELAGAAAASRARAATDQPAEAAETLVPAAEQWLAATAELAAAERACQDIEAQMRLTEAETEQLDETASVASKKAKRAPEVMALAEKIAGAKAEVLKIGAQIAYAGGAWDRERAAEAARLQIETGKALVGKAADVGFKVAAGAPKLEPPTPAAQPEATQRPTATDTPKVEVEALMVTVPASASSDSGAEKKPGDE